MKTIHLLLLFLLATNANSCSSLFDAVGGNFAGPPGELQQHLTPKMRSLIDEAFADIEPQRLIDFHTHILGMGKNGTGTFLNERMRSPWHPGKFIRYSVFKSAAGIRNLENADREYVDRLVELIEHIPRHGRYMAMAFDRHYRRDGTFDEEYTDFSVPNGYVFHLAKRYPQLFVPMISVHPYKPGAVEELRMWAEKGARFVKWLPNAMGIDPSDEKIDPFYRVMKEYDMVLLTHTGEEQAVESAEFQRLGNPLLLRRPLEMGVRVVMAHCASLGTNPDLDSPGREEVSNFSLFLRMMAEQRYQGLLFGEISSIVLFNRFEGHLEVLLEKEELHSRLINGSDYPLPAVNIAVRTGSLEEAGFITAEEREALNGIYRYNPLLFDFVLKRTLRHPRSGRKFPPSLFLSPFGTLWAAAPAEK